MLSVPASYVLGPLQLTIVSVAKWRAILWTPAVRSSATGSGFRRGGGCARTGLPPRRQGVTARRAGSRWEALLSAAKSSDRLPGSEVNFLSAYCGLISTRRASASLPPAPASTNNGGFMARFASATPPAFRASRTARARLWASSSFLATSPVLSV